MPKREIAKIGRPGLGGEFFALEHVGHDRYVIRRKKRVNHQRDELRQCNVGDLPAAATIDDLLTAIEQIVVHEAENGRAPHMAQDFDFRGFAGNSPSIRERLAKLAGWPS